MPEFPTVCAHRYALPIYTKMIQKAIDDSKAVEKGYDNVWKYYEEQSRQLITAQLEKFMNDTDGKGRKHFMCKKEDDVDETRCDNNKAHLTDTNNLLYRFIDENARRTSGLN